MSDFFEALVELGGEGKRWRSGWAILGLVLGLAAGGYLGWMTGGIGNTIISAGLGGFLGWILFVMLRGFLRFAVLFLVLIPVVVGWYWITGKL